MFRPDPDMDQTLQKNWIRIQAVKYRIYIRDLILSDPDPKTGSKLYKYENIKQNWTRNSACRLPATRTWCTSGSTRRPWPSAPPCCRPCWRPSSQSRTCCTRIARQADKNAAWLILCDFSNKKLWDAFLLRIFGNPFLRAAFILILIILGKRGILSHAYLKAQS